MSRFISAAKPDTIYMLKECFIQGIQFFTFFILSIGTVS